VSLCVFGIVGAIFVIAVMGAACNGLPSYFRALNRNVDQLSTKFRKPAWSSIEGIVIGGPASIAGVAPFRVKCFLQKL